jgi:hypothetical protein
MCRYELLSVLIVFFQERFTKSPAAVPVDEEYVHPPLYSNSPSKGSREEGKKHGS